MMTFDLALRTTEVLLAVAFLQQCAEHILGSRDARHLFLLRAILSVALLLGVQSQWVLLAMSIHSLTVLHRYQGPYNGGSDRIGLLTLYCLCLAHWFPDGIAAEAAFGYLSVQVILSYFISGFVKVVGPDWRSGRALQDVFAFSAYPVSASLRVLAHYPRLLWFASWAVMSFELLFPFSLLNGTVLIVFLGGAVAFHVANACLFGLNRFVWFWVATYPSILWFHFRLLAGA